MEVEFLKSAFDPAHYPPPDKPEVAFAGRSNVGKSSLINVLVNRRGLARTSSRPGRTQALNFFLVNRRLYMVDLPGYGYARVPAKVKASWGPMVETYLSSRANLKAVVTILDVRREPAKGDLDLLGWLKDYGVPAVLVLTKADKLSRNQAFSRAKAIGREIERGPTSDPILFSARTKQGRDELWDQIERIVTA